MKREEFEDQNKAMEDESVGGHNPQLLIREVWQKNITKDYTDCWVLMRVLIIQDIGFHAENNLLKSMRH